MNEVLALAPGVRLEPLGDRWVAFSPLSGETLVLNDECAAIIEVLGERPATLETICGALSADTGLPADKLQVLVQSAWPPIVEAGLVVTTAAGPCR